MNTERVGIILSLLVCLCVTSGSAELKTKPFCYHEGFEGNQNPFQFLSARGKYTVNYQGITGEKAFSGKKSWKLDVTLDPGGAYTLAIPLDKIPVGDNLKFSGMLLVEKCLPKSRAVMGLDFSYWPCMPEASGARSFPWNVECNEWARISADIPDRSRATARRLFPYQFWSVEPAVGPGNTSNYVLRVFIQVFTRDTGDADRRFIVYIDDLRIEGEVADREEFKKDAEKRWAPVVEKTNRKIDSWESILVKAEQELATISGLSPEAAKLKAELEKKLAENDVRKMAEIKQARTNGWLTAATYEKMEAFCNNLKSRYIENIKNLSRPEVAARMNTGKHLVYAVDTTATPADRVLPDTVLLPGKITDEISLTACPGEYEPASFVVRALSDIHSLKVQAGGLTGQQGKIDASAVDIKVIKCWYQEEAGARRTLMPELLLNDENLVQVDHANKISRIRFNLPQGEKHLCFDDPEWPKPVLRTAPLPADYPTWVSNDSETLLPVEVLADTNKQFWVTVKVPDEAKAGDYKGKISLLSDGVQIGEVTLSVTVLPIKLSAPYYQASVFGPYHQLGPPSIYYRGKLFPSGYEMIEKRYRNEIMNQVAHGLTVPPGGIDDGAGGDFLGPLFHRETLEKSLKIRKELAPAADRTLLGASHIIHRGLGIKSHKGGLTEIEITEKQKNRFLKEFAGYVKIVRSYGMEEVYFHLADERDAKELEAWLHLFDIVHQAGGKVLTCSKQDRTFETVAGRNDLFFCENGISKREADKWHSKGTKVWPVWNPSGGIESSDLSRRHHGLLVWQTGCDGVTEYLYSLESGWIEAASGKGGGGDGVHNLVYRTTEGIIDTIQWEGYREGIDDVRYVTTLEKLIAQAKQTGKKKAEAAAAEKYLENIDVEYGDLDQIRSDIAVHILKMVSKEGDL